ncbi:MAG: Glycosyltransferase, group 1 family protein [Microgenomates group bacterium GW2011_GWC1_39_7b]|uniref:Glycosyltransferase, group 1 family protein n=3 Tax=Candidatus Woeseibacteriota TaxID=1752722 RepID=A0A0G0PQU4_9BACT|nr:MAG: Glycosyltransferase, group 1 family protein [Candidatus Woesebacteria bacterium GW2011_GWB1_39_10]KKR26894.1 MAG: Glycosyltransferase, group 1 family protein [Microgenomates group bacterium GW2011_GWC1_39_7b]KKR73745.1 MAG: Glycosyltransferase, group 1 family protein [Candidatus Woesebacteria bacterium GW2011_GWA2_40_7]KKS90713.1 MAG: Glycosyltransferase, group 1 family protein [Candidatus Woesebacteria bacterium GW2011_GWA1_43_12]
MNILFITRLYHPHIGGVEKHVYEVAKSLKRKRNSVTILTEKYNSGLKDKEITNGIEVVRFSYPHIKFLGLLFIWREIFKNRKLIQEADVVHIHDIFIWYLPFRFLYPKKAVFTTIHGLEWDNPLSKFSIWQKRLVVKLSAGTIGVGKFLEKYLKVKFNKIIYGAATVIHSSVAKEANSIVYVGRLEENTGLCKFLEWLANKPAANKAVKYEVDFCGDGQLRKECGKYGKVHGFTDPAPFFKKAKYCVPGGYLAVLEAISYRCKLKLFWNNKVKEDYWKMSPFSDKNVKQWVKSQTWDKLANEYLDLYNNAK